MYNSFQGELLNDTTGEESGLKNGDFNLSEVFDFSTVKIPAHTTVGVLVHVGSGSANPYGTACY